MNEELPDVMALPASVLVVEGDAGDREKLKRLLTEMGIERIVTVESGAEASEQITQETFGAVVLCWEAPDMKGLALFNRIKARVGYAAVPLLVTSKLVHKRDFELLREYPCCRHLAKPVNPGAFETALLGAISEHAWYTENTAYLDGLLASLSADPKPIIQEIGRLLRSTPEPATIGLIVARGLTAHGYLKAAGTVLEKLLDADKRSPAVLWELARVYYLSNRPADARRLLETAERVSAASVERLCFQGEVNLALHEPKAARACFQKCLTVDSAHERAQAGEVIAQNLDSFVRTSAGHQLPRTLASTCNTLGVHLAQTGKAADGLLQYKAALSFLGDVPDASRIAFNLALGHLRLGDADAALAWFKKAEALAGVAYPKAARYRAQVEKALAEGRSLPQPEAEEPVDDDIMEESIGGVGGSEGFDIDSLGDDLDGMISGLGRGAKSA